MARLRHVGIIPDGTRRWAKENRHDLKAAYITALAKLCRHVECCYAAGAEDVSLYLLSRQNLKRSREDLAPYIAAGLELFCSMLPTLVRECQAAPVLAGHADNLPDDLKEPVLRLVSSAESSKRRLFLCAPYDPVAELNDAARRWQQDGYEASLLDYLWVPVPIDLVVRTGGARTLSNFLPLQAGYSQIIFLDELFNDLTESAFERILEHHAAQDFKRGE